MRFRIAISHLLAVLAVLGLLIAPFAPAAATGRDDSSTGHHVELASEAAAAMPSDMPCCPDKAPAPDCAKACPLMATCMANNLQTTPGTCLDLPPGLGSVMLPGSDSDFAGLRHGPPPRPPNT
jgi:hypothetical protein